MAEGCEWDPARNSPAVVHRSTGEAFGCPNDAVWSVGQKNNWHLCDHCAGLPRFKRMTYRKLLRKPSAGPREMKTEGA